MTLSQINNTAKIAQETLYKTAEVRRLVEIKGFSQSEAIQKVFPVIPKTIALETSLPVQKPMINNNKVNKTFLDLRLKCHSEIAQKLLKIFKEEGGNTEWSVQKSNAVAKKLKTSIVSISNLRRVYDIDLPLFIQITESVVDIPAAMQKIKGKANPRVEQAKKDYIKGWLNYKPTTIHNQQVMKNPVVLPKQDMDMLSEIINNYKRKKQILEASHVDISFMPSTASTYGTDFYSEMFDAGIKKAILEGEIDANIGKQKFGAFLVWKYLGFDEKWVNRSKEIHNRRYR
jgi:hypothetical protein